MNELVFLKLGGSLITDKNQPRTPQMAVLDRLGAEIRAALEAKPGLRLVIGHGSGSFGHVPAHRHGTRQGVATAEQWRGFVEVWQDARALNQLVVESLSRAGLPVIALPPSASVSTADGTITGCHLAPLTAALQAGLLPLINGDVIFDSVRGGTILSTEELFFYMARQLHPRRILLAGIEAGVWRDFPTCSQLITRITPGNLAQVRGALGGSAAVDVTGGMLKKVESMIDLVKEVTDLEVLIFSGTQPGLTTQALLGAQLGTLISAS